MNIRLLPSIITSIKVLAENEGKTYSQWVREAVEDKLDKYKPTTIGSHVIDMEVKGENQHN